MVPGGGGGSVYIRSVFLEIIAPVERLQRFCTAGKLGEAFHHQKHPKLTISMVLRFVPWKTAVTLEFSAISITVTFY